MSDANWWVIKTRSRAEKKLVEKLNEAGFEVVCPTYTTIRQWSDRKKKVEVPLISCVVFVRVMDGRINELYSFPQVTAILKEHGKPALVRDFELQNLLVLCGKWQEDLISQENYSEYQPGDAVEVVSGGFAGMRGEMVKNQGKHKIFVVIKSLQMVFSVVIPKSQVKLITKSSDSALV